MTDHKKPGWAFWTLLSATILILYVLSIGPACWLSRLLGTESFLIIYHPIGWVASNCRPVGFALAWYLHVWGIDLG